MSHRQLRVVGIGAALVLLAVGTILNRATATPTTWQASPTNFQTLIGLGSPVQPGDTINVQPGVYGCVYSGVNGTPDAPIVVQAQPGAVLDGAACTSPQANTGTTVLNVASDDIEFWNVEITDSIADTFNPEPGSNPANRRPNGISVFGDRVKVINSYIHDTGDGIGFNQGAADTEIHGTVIARSGWYSTDRSHGHGLYVQNETGIKNITDTFVLDSYESGVHVYATAGLAVGIHFDGLVVANSGSPTATGPDRVANLLIGTEQNPADDIAINASVFYQPAGANGGERVGYGVPGNRTSMTNSYLVGGSQALDIKGWQQATVTGNTFYATAGGNRNASDILAYAYLPGATANWDGNTYFDRTWPNSDGVRTPFAYNGTVGPDSSGLLSWDSWRTNSGFDATSTYTQDTPPDKVISQPNRYQPGRSNVIVLNWSRQPSIDLGTGRVYDARTMTYVGSGVVPTPDEFHAFVVIADDTQPTTTVAPTTTTTHSTSTTTTRPCRHGRRCR